MFWYRYKMKVSCDIVQTRIRDGNLNQTFCKPQKLWAMFYFKRLWLFYRSVKKEFVDALPDCMRA